MKTHFKINLNHPSTRAAISSFLHTVVGSYGISWGTGIAYVEIPKSEAERLKETFGKKAELDLSRI